MSNLDLVMQWHDNINQVEKTEAIVGGALGNANQAVKQLAENILWVKKNLKAYKVGDVYVTTLNHASATAVAAHHGYGTWERYADGRTLVGLSDNANDPADYKTMGNEFGENKHTLTVEESASHKHGYLASHEGGENRDNDPTGFFSINNSPPIVEHSSLEIDGSETYPDGTGNNMTSSGGGQLYGKSGKYIVQDVPFLSL